MQATARSKYIRMSPMKIARVLSLVKDKYAEEALDVLHFTRKNAAEPIRKTLLSAISNLGNLEEGQRQDLKTIRIIEAYVTGGPVLKRYRPMSMGRAGKIRKRTSHLTITVEDLR